MFWKNKIFFNSANTNKWFQSIIQTLRQVKQSFLSSMIRRDIKISRKGVGHIVHEHLGRRRWMEFCARWMPRELTIKTMHYITNQWLWCKIELVFEYFPLPPIIFNVRIIQHFQHDVLLVQFENWLKQTKIPTTSHRTLFWIQLIWLNNARGITLFWEEILYFRRVAISAAIGIQPRLFPI